MNEEKNKIKVLLNDGESAAIDGTRDIAADDLTENGSNRDITAVLNRDAGSIEDRTTLDAVLDDGPNLLAYLSNTQIYTEGGGGGSLNYNELYNKPSIEGVTLTGNKTLEQLGITEITTAEIDAMFE